MELFSKNALKRFFNKKTGQETGFRLALAPGFIVCKFQLEKYKMMKLPVVGSWSAFFKILTDSNILQ